MRPGPSLLIRQPRVCLTLEHGALVGVRRAPFSTSDLIQAGGALEEALHAHPSGLVMLIVFRLDPRFPLEPGFENVGNVTAALRSFDRALRAVATVHEFGGVRAAAMRMAARSVWALARPRCEHAMFDRVTDAALWLAPRAQAIGAPDDIATYVRGYQAADSALREQDRESLRP